MITEDGTGLPNATSYTTVVFFQDRYANRPENTVVSALTTLEIESALERSTETVDLYYRYPGDPLLDTQALGYPRTGATNNCTGQAIASGVVPIYMQIAICDYAIFLLQEDSSGQSSELGGSALESNDILEFKFDNIEIVRATQSQQNSAADSISAGRGIPAHVNTRLMCIAYNQSNEWYQRRATFGVPSEDEPTT